MKNLLIIGLTCITLVSCQTQPDKEVVAVSHIGELREIMHQGAIQSRVDLDTLAKDNLYGLGALDSLSGEILVLDGDVYRSEVMDSVLSVNQQSSTSASLFVFSRVESWDTVNVEDFYGTDELLAGVSAERSLEQPFPFILIGSPSVLEFHVLNFDDKTMDIGNHKEGSYTGTIRDKPVKILGFYSTNAKGVYTHHDTNVHMHFISKDQLIMGHVDRLDGENQQFNLLIPMK